MLNTAAEDMQSNWAKKIMLRLLLLMMVMVMKAEQTPAVIRQWSSNLPESLWGSEEALKLREKAWESKFVGGVVNGTLDPNFWAKFWIQDAYWVVGVAHVWGYVSQHASNQRLREFANRSANSWLTYGQDLTLNLTGIIPGPDASSYLGFIQNAKASEYVVIATYPCAKLWPYLAQRCNNSIPSPPMHVNAYIEWCHQGPGSSLHNLEQLIQAFYLEGKILHDEAKQLFLHGLKHEVSFFNNA